jgi:hypothetical protein
MKNIEVSKSDAKTEFIWNRGVRIRVAQAPSRATTIRVTTTTRVTTTESRETSPTKQ